ncbi:MAG TPA: membrane protein insertase YidC, partial [Candidatus Polarisedimenticolia bacterium]|nr:membrane protein insertase YidC [Candidatus Polarisedimenticolia bacterium]
PVPSSGRAIAATAERDIVVDSPLYTVRLTNRGARIVSWQLKRYRDDEGRPLQLVSDAGAKIGVLPLQLQLEDEEATRALRDGLYRVERAEHEEGGARITELTFTWSNGAGLGAIKTLRLADDSYLAHLTVTATRGGRPVDPAILWGAGFGSHNGLENGRFADAAMAVLNLGEKTEIRAASSIKTDAPWLQAGTIRWSGLADKYFAAVLIPPGPSAGEVRAVSHRLIEDGREHFFLSLGLQVPGVSRFDLFVGPKDYDLLKTAGLGLDRLLNFGFFGVVARPLFYALKFVERYVGNWGWAIIILTVFIRLLFFPITHRSQVNMKKMQEKMKRVQPKVKSMRERYRKLERKEVERGNVGARHKLRQKMNEEMMALYKEEGINPLGGMSGCLPLLLQMPILYAFYTILSIAIELRKAPFLLWIKDLSHKDPYYVTPIVMGVSMLAQQMMTSGSIADPAQRKMMYLMPVMFTYFFINLPSGLVLYWLVNNLLGIVQQHLINKQVAAEAEAA